ncbi:cupin domain-containing protein [Ureibacillus sinduriensis]
MSRIIQTGNGIVGYHQAIVPQLFLVLNGEGFVRNDKEVYFKVQSGDAVFWGKDEWHKTKIEVGLTAIVIESEELTPSLFMPLKK